jgi:hypothetical protein
MNILIGVVAPVLSFCEMFVAGLLTAKALIPACAIALKIAWIGAAVILTAALHCS